MKKVLVAIDFSDNALNALKYAFLFAHDLNLEVNVVSVLPPYIDPINSNIYIGQMIQDQLNSSKNQLTQFADNAISSLNISPDQLPAYNLYIKTGNIIGEINDLVEEKGIDLIIVGTRGNNHTKWEKIMGTVSTGIAERALKPVLIIPDHVTYQKIKSIVFASNLLDSDPLKIFEVSQILDETNCKLRVLHINTEEKDPIDKSDVFKTMLEKENIFDSVEFFTINDTNINTDIVTFVQSFDVNLLVINQTHHSLWSRMFGSSHTRELVSKVDWPLLVMK